MYCQYFTQNNNSSRDISEAKTLNLKIKNDLPTILNVVNMTWGGSASGKKSATLPPQASCKLARFFLIRAKAHQTWSISDILLGL
jgi:hypothetical protein